jgi:uncharacterized protein
MALSPQLLRVLACPGCRGQLEAFPDGLRCLPCALKFPIRDGVPVLLLSEAEHAPATK